MTNDKSLGSGARKFREHAAKPLPEATEAMAVNMDAVVAAIARRIAKREYGESYEGYESGHLEAARDYAEAALSAR